VHTGSHSGAPNGSENPAIDNPWVFFGSTGMHGALSPSNVLTASGNTATIDFSGWSIAWNGLDSIPLGTGAWFESTMDGMAQITCAVDCGDGDMYTLIYSATTVPDGSSSYGNTQYMLNLTGSISATPVPQISISINGGGVQECTVTGGHNVTVTSSVGLFNAVLDRIEWKLDGQMVATGESFSEFLSLGSHVISATAFTVTGEQNTASTNITIVDTVAPEISAAFIDKRSGSEITIINKKHTHHLLV